MEESFVHFKTAKLAKEKGFINGCKSSYTHYHKQYTYDGDKKHPESHKKDEVRLCCSFWTINNDREDNEHYSLYEAPTQSLLQKWLRERQGINFHVDYSDHFDQYALHFQSPKTSSRGFSVIRDTYSTYEQALEAGLVEALNLIP